MRWSRRCHRKAANCPLDGSLITLWVSIQLSFIIITQPTFDFETSFRCNELFRIL